MEIQNQDSHFSTAQIRLRRKEKRPFTQNAGRALGSARSARCYVSNWGLIHSRFSHGAFPLATSHWEARKQVKYISVFPVQINDDATVKSKLMHNEHPSPFWRNSAAWGALTCCYRRHRSLDDQCVTHCSYEIRKLKRFANKAGHLASSGYIAKGLLAICAG